MVYTKNLDRDGIVVFNKSSGFGDEYYGKNLISIQSVSYMQEMDYMPGKSKIFVNDASTLEKSQINNIYKLFADKKIQNQTFILLG